MPLTFYPHENELETSNLQTKLEVLMDAAERYKAAALEVVTKESEEKRATPKDIRMAFNWEEIARVLREIRELPESSDQAKLYKADRLTKLSEIYEVLRAAKMPKLEAVRIALINEASQLRSSAEG